MSADMWAKHGLTEPIPLNNSDYQEKCMKCGILFWGQRDTLLCKPCAEFDRLKEEAK